MAITLQLSAEEQKLFEELAAQQNSDAARKVLLKALDAAVETILRAHAQPQPEMRQKLLDELAVEFADLPAISAETLTRDRIYGDPVE